MEVQRAFLLVNWFERDICADTKSSGDLLFRQATTRLSYVFLAVTVFQEFL